jgi:hypothetical protein
MYAQLLEGICRRNNLADEVACANHLRGLQQHARTLWQSYQQQNVVGEYSNPATQEVYLLRYFPFYCLPIAYELDRLHKAGFQLPQVELLEAAFFGCGPGPEVIGLMLHLGNVEAPTTMISAQMLDSAAEGWGYARNLVLEHLAEPFWEPRLIDYVPTQACLTDGAKLASAAVDGCHFAVVQNCLNEVPFWRRNCVAVNLMSQFARLAPGAVALVIDRSGYEATDKMLRNLHAFATESENVVPLYGPRHEKTPCTDMLNGVPDIVTNNLFHRSGDIKPDDWAIDGLIFSKQIDYVSMAFQVCS